MIAFAEVLNEITYNDTLLVGAAVGGYMWLNKFGEIVTELGFNATLLIGGAIGGLIGLNKKRPFWRQFLTVLASAFIANYTTPLVLEIFDMGVASTAGIGFIIGYSNKHFLEYIIEKLKKKKEII